MLSILCVPFVPRVLSSTVITFLLCALVLFVESVLSMQSVRYSLSILVLLSRLSFFTTQSM